MKLSHMIFGTLGAFLVAQPIGAQVVRGDAVRAYSTREALQGVLDRLNKSASSSAYSAVLRERADDEANVIRRRLQEGDFQVGDRILLMVEDQPLLSDTFTVDQGQVLTLPTVGDVRLTGILRSELKQHMLQHLERFFREPVVRARALIRLAVVGGVERPGFYTVAGEALLTDAIMMAGGPAADAKIDEMRVERGESTIWEGRPLQAAMDDGRTLDELNLRAGDRIVIPQRGAGLGGLQGTTFLLGLPLSIAALIAIF